MCGTSDMVRLPRFFCIATQALKPLNAEVGRSRRQKGIMMSNWTKASVAEQIQNFIVQRQRNRDGLEWPDDGFEVIGVKNVKINEDSLQDFGERWTFKGTAVIGRTNAGVTTDKQCSFVGTAHLGKFGDMYVPPHFKEPEWPKVKAVTITKVKNSLI